MQIRRKCSGHIFSPAFSSAAFASSDGRIILGDWGVDALEILGKRRAVSNMRYNC